jgi:hypothetical protein
LALLAGVPFTAGPIRAAAVFLAATFDAAGFLAAGFGDGDFLAASFAAGFLAACLVAAGFRAASFVAGAAFFRAGAGFSAVAAALFAVAAGFLRPGPGLAAAGRFATLAFATTGAFRATGAFRGATDGFAAAGRFATAVFALRAGVAARLPVTGLADDGFPAEGLPADALPAEGFRVEGSTTEGLPAEGLPTEGLPAEARRTADFPTAATIVPAALVGRGDVRDAPRTSVVGVFLVAPPTMAGGDAARPPEATFFVVATSGVTARPVALALPAAGRRGRREAPEVDASAAAGALIETAASTSGSALTRAARRPRGPPASGRSFSPLAADDGSRPVPRTFPPSSRLSPRRLIPTRFVPGYAGWSFR